MYCLKKMSSRLLLVVAVLLFGRMAVVSSEHSTIEDHETQAVVKGANRRLLPFLNCEGLCNQRCSKHSRPNVCTRACGTCCMRCKCVPPGTAGNREACGTCYTDMTTHHHRIKCP